MADMRQVSLLEIDPPEAPIRQRIPEDLIEELATSILAVGLIEPLVVEALNGRYRIIAGHRRYLACKRAGLLQIPVVVRDTSEVKVEAVQIQENIIRQDMSAAEEARLFYRVYLEEGEDIEKVAGRVKLSVSYVDARLALLKGDPLILDALDAEDINLGVAQALNTIGHEAYRRECLDLAVRSGATISIVKRWAAERNGLARIQTTGEAPPPAPAPAVDYHPVAESVCCWFCEGNHDLHTLRMLQIHAGCVGALEALLKKIGRDA